MQRVWMLVVVVSGAACAQSPLGPHPQARGTGTTAAVVSATDQREAPTAGGPWAAFCAYEPAPACHPRLIEVCTDPYDSKSCSKQLAEQVSVCVKHQIGPVETGYTWECALTDWYTRQE